MGGLGNGRHHAEVNPAEQQARHKQQQHHHANRELHQLGSKPVSAFSMTPSDRLVFHELDAA
jgi:hypothetical protein